MTEQQSAIRALIKLGETRRDIATRLGCSYDTVTKEIAKMKKEEDHDATKVDMDLLQHVITETKETAPPDIKKRFEVIEEGVTGLQKLDGRFHDTMANILSKADGFMNREDLTIGEWATITNAVGNAYKNIFAQSGVNVNVNNGTQFSDTKLSMFKGALRG